MHRRNFLLHSAILTAGSLLIQKKALAQLLNMPDYNLKMLRKNVGIFTERGGTIGFLLSKDGIVVIDAQFPDTATHLIEELKKNNAPFHYLLNTHHHGDHTSGNIAFKGLVGHVVAHENSLINQKNVAEKQNTLDKQLLPDQTFSKDWKLKMGDEKIKADYWGPGHTNGDAVYHFEEANIVHVGDLMFNRRHPFVDRSAGANMANWIAALDKISKKYSKDTQYIFGHANTGFSETGTADDLIKFKDYLQKVLDFANAAIKKGVTKEDFIKNTSIPGVTEWTGQGIERPLTAAYEELTENKKA